MQKDDLLPLKDLALPIVAPKELPGAFKIYKIEAHQDGDGYEIEWKSETAELRLRAASSGVGDSVENGERIPFETPYFGQCYLERSGEELISEWFSEMQSGLPAYSVVAKGLEPEEVIDFVRSLDYVRVN